MPTQSLRYSQQYFQLSNDEIMSKYETPITRLSKMCNKYFNLGYLFYDSLSRFKEITRSLLKFE